MPVPRPYRACHPLFTRLPTPGSQHQALSPAPAVIGPGGPRGQRSEQRSEQLPQCTASAVHRFGSGTLEARVGKPPRTHGRVSGQGHDASAPVHRPTGRGLAGSSEGTVTTRPCIRTPQLPPSTPSYPHSVNVLLQQMPSFRMSSFSKCPPPANVLHPGSPRGALRLRRCPASCREAASEESGHLGAP